MKPEELEDAFFARLEKMEAVYKEEIDRVETEAEKEIDASIIAARASDTAR